MNKLTSVTAVDFPLGRLILAAWRASRQCTCRLQICPADWLGVQLICLLAGLHLQGRLLPGWLDGWQASEIDGQIDGRLVSWLDDWMVGGLSASQAG